MNQNEEELRKSFKPIEENPIILNFEECKYPAEIHQILKVKFGLPEYYGENWSALWDCLDGLFEDDEIIIVEIYGFLSLPKKLREWCDKMVEIFDRVHNETPNFTYEIIS